MVESAIFMPLFLLILFGIIWAVQSSVQSERVQIAVRYGGLVSNEAAPYVGYSLYGLYLAAASPAVNTSCSSPTTDALTDSGAFPGPTSAPFWSPEANKTSGSCTKGAAVLSGGNLSSSLVFLSTQSSITTQVLVPTLLQPTLKTANQNLSASQTFFDTPDLGTLMKCYSDLDSAVTQSLTNATLNVTAAATPLPDNNPTTPLAVSC
ncbi:MAG TPA: TadE family protein [Candidatus Baltobacteraceae bacterium]|jgi:hypothetical protein|nr:TadE family protein [Candidatus Baltobacteraceae bacterium]